MNAATNVIDEIIEKRFEASGADGLSVEDAVRLLAPKYGDGTPNAEAMPIVLDWMMAVAVRVQEPGHKKAEAKRRADHGQGVRFSFPAEELEGLDDDGLRAKYDEAMSEYQATFTPAPFRVDRFKECITRKAILVYNQIKPFPFDLPSGWIVATELDIWTGLVQEKVKGGEWFKVAGKEIHPLVSTITIHSEYSQRLCRAGFAEINLSTFKKWITEQTPSRSDYPTAILSACGTNRDNHQINWKGQS